MILTTLKSIRIPLYVLLYSKVIPCGENVIEPGLIGVTSNDNDCSRIGCPSLHSCGGKRVGLVSASFQYVACLLRHRFNSHSSAVHAQHLFIYLAIHPKWHRLEHLNNVEIPSGDMLCTIVELCCPIYNHFAVADRPAEAKSESPDVYVKAEQSSPVLLKGELPSETKSETKPDHFSGSLPRPSNADIKLTPSQPNATAGPSTLFPFPRPQPNPSSLCISDAELTLRQLLEYMDPKEQNKIRDQLKIKPGKKVIIFFSKLQHFPIDFGRKRI